MPHSPRNDSTEACASNSPRHRPASRTEAESVVPRTATRRQESATAPNSDATLIPAHLMRAWIHLNHELAVEHGRRMHRVETLLMWEVDAIVQVELFLSINLQNVSLFSSARTAIRPVCISADVVLICSLQDRCREHHSSST